MYIYIYTHKGLAGRLEHLRRLPLLDRPLHGQALLPPHTMYIYIYIIYIYTHIHTYMCILYMYMCVYMYRERDIIYTTI